jgi:hypothetical protein
MGPNGKGRNDNEEGTASHAMFALRRFAVNHRMSITESRSRYVPTTSVTSSLVNVPVVTHICVQCLRLHINPTYSISSSRHITALSLIYSTNMLCQAISLVDVQEHLQRPFAIRTAMLDTREFTVPVEGRLAIGFSYHRRSSHPLTQRLHCKSNSTPTLAPAPSSRVRCLTGFLFHMGISSFAYASHFLISGL